MRGNDDDDQLSVKEEEECQKCQGAYESQQRRSQLNTEIFNVK